MATLLLDKNLTKDPAHANLELTHIGQANIANTGPKGKTCRECVHWWRDVSKHGGHKVERGHFHLGHVTNKGELRRAYCNYPIAGKAYNLFPHEALACSLFEQSENPPLISKPKRKTKAELKAESTIEFELKGDYWKPVEGTKEDLIERAAHALEALGGSNFAIPNHSYDRYRKILGLSGVNVKQAA